jgi:hypothetical protein
VEVKSWGRRGSNRATNIGEELVVGTKESDTEVDYGDGILYR